MTASAEPAPITAAQDQSRKVRAVGLIDPRPPARPTAEGESVSGEAAAGGEAESGGGLEDIVRAGVY